MRSLFCAKSGDTSSAQVDLPASPSVASGCVVAPDATPAPIPSGSVLQTIHDLALIDDELDARLSDLPFVQLSTYDLTRSALCRSQKKRLEINFQHLQLELQAGVQRLDANLAWTIAPLLWPNLVVMSRTLCLSLSLWLIRLCARFNLLTLLSANRLLDGNLLFKNRLHSKAGKIVSSSSYRLRSPVELLLWWWLS